MVGSDQFGSICSSEEYESEVHTFSVAADWQATDKLNLNGDLIYNLSEDTWDWSFTERPSLTSMGDPVTIYDTKGQNNRISSYSDLEYDTLEWNFGGTYNVNDSCYVKANVGAEYFMQDQEYVYGDEEGDVYRGYVGFGYTF